MLAALVFTAGHRNDIDGEAGLPFDDHRRKLHAAEILIEAVPRVGRHIAENIVIDPRQHSFDEVLIVDVSNDFVFVLRGEGHDG